MAILRMPTFRTRWRDSNSAKMQAATFAQLWRNFESAGTVLDGRYDTDRWKSQPGKFAAVIVRLDETTFDPRFEELIAALSQLDVARVHPGHFLHIMLQELGILAKDPQGRSQISLTRLDEFCDAAVSTISRAAPFEITLGGVNAFRDAVILEVQDQGVLSRLHRRLNELAAVPVGSPYAYLPHLTLAHFIDNRASGAVVGELRRWRDTDFGHVNVSRLDVVLIDVRQTYPEFEEYRQIELTGQRR